MSPDTVVEPMGVDLLGLTPDQAVAALQPHGINLVRITAKRMEDGTTKPLIGTRDFRTDRLGVTVDHNGLIVGVGRRG